jgi:hypothetical protein
MEAIPVSNDTYPARAVARGCGTRTKGGLYWTTGTCRVLSDTCRPLEEFLLDPPRLLPDKLKVPTKGITYLTDAHGVTHIVDRIGMKHYPNVADFVEEVRRFGLSRKMPPGLAVKDLDPKRSRLLLVHDRAYIDNWIDFLRQRNGVTCPKAIDSHPLLQMCIGLWWHDLDPATLDDDLRLMPSFTYLGAHHPEGFEPQYRPAIFASFPCWRFERIGDPNKTDPDDKVNQRVVDAGFDLEVVPE